MNAALSKKLMYFVQVPMFHLANILLEKMKLSAYKAVFLLLMLLVFFVFNFVSAQTFKAQSPPASRYVWSEIFEFIIALTKKKAFLSL